MGVKKPVGQEEANPGCERSPDRKKQSLTLEWITTQKTDPQSKRESLKADIFNRANEKQRLALGIVIG